MIWLLLLAAKAAAPAAAVPPPVDPSILTEAAHALDEGRLDQARLMIGRAVGAGMSGPPVHKLLADLAFVAGNYDDALNEYEALAATGDREQKVCENGMISALKLGRLSEARPFADCATPAHGATWRAWNARGVLADIAQDWDAASTYYSRAHQLAPRSAEVVNNQGWSLVLRGEWAAALPYFELAASLDPNSQRIADNLELARTALDAALPERRAGESSEGWAARLNDAGVAAQLLGDKKRAIAAFTQALYANDHWYARAANNLENVARP